ncbi:MAG: hypothetical protein K0R94_1635 [Burkholderiales bacterium]|nr:hypothetical protein [Burkholderiales bacterium]
MAHFDLHEQEQLTRLKYFWRDWGKYIIAVLVIAVMAYVAEVIWESYTTSRAAKAAIVFNSLNTTKDAATVYKLADSLKNKYPGTEYTPMGLIVAAKLANDNKDKVKAGAYLKWVIKNSKDKGLAAFAMLRLANIYIDEQKFDLALSTLMQKHEASFDVLFYERRGDLYVARNDLTKARDAYKEALEKAGQDQNTANGIQMKLDVIGG